MEPTEQPITMNRTLATSLAAIALAVIALFVMLLPVLRAAFLPSVDDVAPEERVAQLLTEHEKEMVRYQARFNGRSIFFTPPQPTPPPMPRVERDRDEYEPPVVVIDDEPDEVEKPRVKPDYNGPNIRAVIGDEVWFFGDIKVAVGEQKNGVKVLAVDGLWGATVEYGGWEYDVPFFEPFELTDAGEEGEATRSGRDTSPRGLIEVEQDENPNAEADRARQAEEKQDQQQRQGERPSRPTEPKREDPPPT